MLAVCDAVSDWHIDVLQVAAIHLNVAGEMIARDRCTEVQASLSFCESALEVGRLVARLPPAD